MIRLASVIGLEPDTAEEYVRLHRDVWPEVLDRLRRSHVVNYSIFRHGLTLFSYFEYTGDDLTADLAAVAADPATQRWWAICEPLQRPFPDRPDGEWWTPMRELFHLD